MLSEMLICVLWVSMSCVIPTQMLIKDFVKYVRISCIIFQYRNSQLLHQRLLPGEKLSAKLTDVGCGTMLLIVRTSGEYVPFIAYGDVILFHKITPHIRAACRRPTFSPGRRL